MPIQNNQPGETKNGPAKYAMPATDDIRKDLSSLQSDVAVLASNVKKAGSDKVHEAVNYINDQVDTIKETGAGALGKIEENIKAKPGQSITIAFAAGLLVSYLLGRRS